MRAFFAWSLGLLLLIVVLLTIAVALAPARLVVLAVERWVPHLQLQLSEPAGTIWQGQLNQVVIPINRTEFTLGKLSWQLSPVSILNSNPSIDLFIEAPTHQATVRASVTRDQVITIENMEGTFPLSLLEPWVPVLVDGDLAFVVDHIVFTQKELLSIDGVLNLQQADWLGGDVEMPLGSYIAQVFLSEHKDVIVQINDFSATLGIDGSIKISPSGAYYFDSILQTRDGLAPEVAQSVSWFGKKNANGDIVVKHRGRWN